MEMPLLKRACSCPEFERKPDENGGFGSVYFNDDLRLDRTVVKKQLIRSLPVSSL